MSSAIPQHSHLRHNTKHRRLRLLLIPLILFIVWVGVKSWTQTELIQEKKQLLEQMRSELVKVKQQNEMSSHEVIRLQDSEFVEQKIRKELNYSKPGETIFYVPTSNE